MAVVHCHHSLPIGDDVAGAGDGRRKLVLTGQGFGHLLRFIHLHHRLHPFDHTPQAGQGTDLAGIAPHHGDLQFVEEAQVALRAQRRRPGSHRVEDDGDAQFVGPAPGDQHGRHPIQGERARIEHQPTGRSHHLGHFLPGVSHHRQSTDMQGDVGRVVHDHEVGDVMEQGLLLANPFPQFCRLFT